jgi:uncharacterized membrane protein
MYMKNGYVFASILLTGIVANLGGCAKEPPKQISFSGQIQPIIQSRCIECHTTGGQGFQASGLSMETYDSLMKGTKFGPVIKPGDPVSSTLMRLIEGKADPSIRMPHGKKPLTDEQIDLFKEWISQGAKNN